MNTFHLIIQTPLGTLFSGEVQNVLVKSELGKLGLLPHHADLVGALGYSTIQLKDSNNVEEEYIARRGTVQFDNEENNLRIVVADCQLKKELSLVSAKEYLALIEDMLAKGESLDNFQLEYMQGEKFLLEKQIREGE